MGSDDKVFGHEGFFLRISNFFVELIDKPVIWFRENVVVPNRKEYYWYHEKLRRVPSIDQCYTDDYVCIYEANEQYKRDRSVDRYILQILKKRHQYCSIEFQEDPEKCVELKAVYDKAADNFFIKYGDLGWKDSAFNCFMKQKNRMAWERRHGPVGTGRKSTEESVSE